MFRAMTVAVCIFMLAVLALSTENAGAYSVPGATDMRAVLIGGHGSWTFASGEPFALMLVGALLVGLSWLARRPARHSDSSGSSVLSPESHK